jgi:hypothetical protein
VPHKISVEGFHWRGLTSDVDYRASPEFNRDKQDRQDGGVNFYVRLRWKARLFGERQNKLKHILQQSRSLPVAVPALAAFNRDKQDRPVRQDRQDRRC